MDITGNHPIEEDPSITEMRKHRGSWQFKDRSPSRLLEFPRTGTAWQLDPFFYERAEYDYTPSAVCVATQAVGPEIGLKAIVKMRINPKRRTQPLENESDLLDFDISDMFGDEGEAELGTLQRLTELGCTATPKLLDYRLELQPETDGDPFGGTYALFIVMEKAPGRSLTNFGDMSMAERNEVRIAFGLALREFYSYGYHHEDPHPRNIIWDAENKKCCIIDLEDVTFQGQGIARPAWTVDFSLWKLKGPGPGNGWGPNAVDPMVVGLNYEREMPDEAGLRSVVDETVEKGLDVFKSFLPWKHKERPF
ncbi:hypothetical protein FQN54_004986 [Arachnomyces sp. PD_36]|nr:hypothetical protein FQN54_004986 [Arachnomyces sp. PD_36]